MIVALERVVPAAPGKPVRAGSAETRRRARRLAEDPSTWTLERAAETVRTYRELAPVWEQDRGGYRPLPLGDALARGGPWPAGRCLEVGCGTGLLTPMLAAVWPQVVCLDLSPDMLGRSGAPWRVRADAAHLPVPDGQVAAVVLADAPLFAAEVVRVLAAGGVVVWSNALGHGAPHHVPVEVIHAALAQASGTAWSAVTAEAGWGLWAVLRRD